MRARLIAAIACVRTRAATFRDNAGHQNKEQEGRDVGRLGNGEGIGRRQKKKL